MSLAAGRLRHRVTIEHKALTQDPDTGMISENWQALHIDVPAAIEPLSAKDFIAAQAMQSQISGRIVIRYCRDIRSDMRVNHNGEIYKIHGVMPDKVSGMEYLTLVVSAGVSENGGF